MQSLPSLSNTTMTSPAKPVKAGRLYTIEFLRIWLMSCVFIVHAMSGRPAFRNWALSLVHSSSEYFNYAVECFFIIGGFFLYKRLVACNAPFQIIRKTYMRLLPALLFAYIILILACTRDIWHFPALLAMTQGIGFHGMPIGAGDYYCGVYFWVTVLFVGLFAYSPKKGWLGLIILIYITLMFRINAKPGGSNKDWLNFYTFIGKDLCRGIFSMGIGVIAGFLSERIKLSRKTPVRIFFTGFEALCLLGLFNYIVRPKHVHFSYYEMEVLFALLLISISLSQGYISAFFNRIHQVMYVSRYVYPAFVGQMITMGIIRKYNNFGWNEWYSATFVICGGILLGIIEYHLVEKYLLPKILNYFKPSEKEDIFAS